MARPTVIDLRINGSQANLTYGELIQRAAILNKEIKKLAPGTQEFVDKSKELRRLNQDLNDIRNNVRGTAGALTNMASAGGVLGTALASIGLASFITRLGESAIELEVQANKFKTVFGDAAPIVEEAAARTATSLGLTIEEYKKAAAAAGDLLIPMGFQRQEAAAISTGLTKLSGALSEWTGGQKTAVEVSDILTKALLGEREQLKTLGIAISEDDVKAQIALTTKGKLTGAALAQAKAVATYQLVLAKSQDAQTAFTNNTDTLVRKKAELRARVASVSDVLAKALIPVLNFLLDVGGKVIDFSARFILTLRAIPQFIKENRVEIGTLIVALVTLNAQTIASTTATLAKAVAEKGAAIATNALTIAQRALNLVLRANPIGLIVTAVGALVIALAQAYKRSETFRAGMDGLLNVAKVFFTIISEGFRAFIAGFTALKEGRFADSIKSFGEAITKLNPIGIASSQGKRLGDAFNKGYADSLAKSKEDGTLAKIAADKEKYQAAGAEAGTAFNQGFDSNAFLGNLEGGPDDKKKKGKGKITPGKISELAPIGSIDPDFQSALGGLELQGIKDTKAAELEFIKEHNASINAVFTQAQRERDELRAQEQANEIEQRRIIYSEGLGLLSDFLSQDEDSRRRHSAIIKAISIAEIGINLQKEISAIWASSAAFGPAQSLIAGIKTALALGRATLAVSKVSAQQFYDGGYTGPGTYKDNTGSRVAGVVHANEWVSPEWMTSHPVYGRIVRGLEQVRNRGYVNGGYVAPSTQPSLSSIPGASDGGGDRALMEAASLLVQAARSIPSRIVTEVAYTDIEAAGNTINRIRSTSNT